MGSHQLLIISAASAPFQTFQAADALSGGSFWTLPPPLGGGLRRCQWPSRRGRRRRPKTGQNGLDHRSIHWNRQGDGGWTGEVRGIFATRPGGAQWKQDPTGHEGFGGWEVGRHAELGVFTFGTLIPGVCSSSSWKTPKAAFARLDLQCGSDGPARETDYQRWIWVAVRSELSQSPGFIVCVCVFFLFLFFFFPTFFSNECGCKSLKRTTVLSCIYSCHFPLGVFPHLQGHFLLVNLLLPNLASAGSVSDPARIISVSSSAHFVRSPLAFGDTEGLNLEDADGEHAYYPWTAYGQSKLAQVATLLPEKENGRRCLVWNTWNEDPKPLIFTCYYQIDSSRM